jgi:protein-S-isoprenylcysteine O-methyltransferase Ste14
MKLHTTRAVIGILVSIALFGVIIPYLYWGLTDYLDRILAFAPMFSEPVALILAAASFIVGLFWIFWSYSHLLFVGRGSPVEAFGMALDPTKRLVTVGPYAFTRNPMILGYLWIILGIGFMSRSLSGILLVPLIAVLAVIYLRYFEERGLIRRFGTPYEHYRETVPILIPAWRVYVKPESITEA